LFLNAAEKKDLPVVDDLPETFGAGIHQMELPAAEILLPRPVTDFHYY